MLQDNELYRLLYECNFLLVSILSSPSQDERITRFSGFKDFQKTRLIAMNSSGSGVDTECVDDVLKYDISINADCSLGREEIKTTLKKI